MSNVDTEVLLRFLKKLSAQDGEIPKTDFNLAIQQMIQVGIVTEQDLASRMKVSIPTIQRWQHTTAPHHLGRKSVIDECIRILQQE